MKTNVLMRFVRPFVMLAPILGLPATAAAYIGPGAGLSVIGSLLAFFAAIFVGIFGFLWFPIRRFLRKRKMAAERKTAELATESDESSDESVSQDMKQGELRRD